MTTRLSPERFSPEQVDFLRTLARFSAAHSFQFYLIGGAVRDALLGRSVVELDLVSSSESGAALRVMKDYWADSFPKYLVPRRILEFPRYRTAKLMFDGEVLPGIATLDFASSRKEHYPSPGARPVTEPGTFEEDVRRRDFSINALAVFPTAQGDFELVDLVGGVEDLRLKTLRILHDRSFVDDPMRILRAARFSARFGFELERETAIRLHEAVAIDALSTVTPQRRGSELLKALREECWNVVLERLREWRVLERLAPQIPFATTDADWPTWEERFCALFDFDQNRVSQAAACFEFDPRVRGALQSMSPNGATRGYSSKAQR